MMKKLGAFMINDNTLKNTYKKNYYHITFSLLLSISPALYAQQLSCGLSCNNQSGGFFSERGNGGTFSFTDVLLTDVSPVAPSFSTTDASTIAIGDASSDVGDIYFNATKLNIDAQNTDYDTRAIMLASKADEITVDMTDSVIKLESTATATDYNTIGLLMASEGMAQFYGINLKNTDMSITSNGIGNTAGGIWTYADDGFFQTNITMDNSNLTVNSELGAAYGIRTEDKDNANVSSIYIKDITESKIKVTGKTDAYGVSVDTAADSFEIDNKSIIEVEATGDNSSKAYGIYSRAYKNDITTNGKRIDVKSAGDAYGIHVYSRRPSESTAGRVFIDNHAAINLDLSPSLGAGQGAGIYVYTDGSDAEINNSGDIIIKGDNNGYGNSNGIQADIGYGGDLIINTTGKIDVSNEGRTGIAAIASNLTINLLAGANVIGGISGTGISIDNLNGDVEINLAHGSQVSALSDKAIEVMFPNSAMINNSGKIIGFVDTSMLVGAGDEKVIFNNLASGVLELRNIPQDGIKDNIYYYIDSENGALNNAGLIKFADANFDGTNTHAEFFVKNFNNSGIIDITGKNPTGANTLVGDTFTITGNYISQGGSIYLNTLLDDASSGSGNGTSDLIIIGGNVITGAGGPTQLIITPTSDSLGGLTTGEGIQVIQVAGSTSSNAFALGRPLVSGAYEYTLHQGQSDSNWYLSSYVTNSGSGAGGGIGKIQYNPAIGAYLANQTASVQMFQQSLFDRLTSSSDVKSTDASRGLFWLRTKMVHRNYNNTHESLSNRSRSYSLQMGGDLNVWALNNGGYLHLGIMGGYGDFKDTTKSDLTGTKAEGKVRGYTAGIYSTYFASQDTNLGLYIDLWSQMGWYRNEVSGKAHVSNKKYNSTVWSSSVEVGYGIPIANTAKYQWLVTPQLQLTYNLYDADNQWDKNNLYVSNNNASGVDTRLGMRFHVRGVKERLIEPFLEVNWLNTTSKNRLNFNGKTLTDGFARDRFEAKVGLQGDINNRWSMSAQVGGQWGNNSYKSYQGQLNINYKF